MADGASRFRWFGTALLVAGLNAGAVDQAVSQSATLADAVQRGDRSAVFSRLTRGADPDGAQGDGATALHWAAYRDDAEMVAALIQAGADVQRANRYGVTPLALAARNGSAAISHAVPRGRRRPERSAAGGAGR